MLTIKDIAYVGYPATDILRARQFYEGLLGLVPSTQFEHEGRHWIEYDVGSCTLAVTTMSPEAWKPSPDGPAVALEVADFEAAVQHLRAAGVRFLVEPTDTGVCHLAVIADPDGNSLAIHRRKLHV